MKRTAAEKLRAAVEVEEKTDTGFDGEDTTIGFNAALVAVRANWDKLLNS